MIEIKNTIKPKKISKGAHIRVIAPARSLKIISEEVQNEAKKQLEEYGFHLSFGRHVNEIDEFDSSSVESRIEDLHDAFIDKNVDAILTVVGGYNSIQLLRNIDYNLIQKNPKIICGFSDVTALANSIMAKTGMITYIGPHFSNWGMKYGFEYCKENFVNCCFSDNSYGLLPSKEWSDDLWFRDQEKRSFLPNDGYWIMNHGHAFGRVVGGHVRCINVLQGTEYWPGLDDSILILEEDSEINPSLFNRELQALIYQPDFSGVRGILIGRFQKETNMSRNLLGKIIKSKKELKDIPIIANVDFGHTTPQVTLPVGGSIEIIVINSKANIRIVEH
jgi:muramoyltetrapeptide carboxypeptidase